MKEIISKHSFWLLLIVLTALLASVRESLAAQLQLTWTDNSANETGFKIDRKTGATGTYTQIASVGANITSYTDSTVGAGTYYCYRVYAYNAEGNSTYAAEICGTAVGPIETFTLAVTKAGTGSGTVTGNPAGINCGSICTGNYTSGATVALTAAPATGSVFAAWAGTDCAATTATVAVTMSANLNCTATFNLQPVSTFTLSIAKAGTGSGTVISNPAGINCGSVCIGTYTSGATVVLTASPAVNSTFVSWSGAGCNASTAIINVSMSATGSCTVTFANGPTNNPLAAKIGVFRPSTGQWFLDSNGNGIFDNCIIDTCITSYGSNAMLPIVADWDGTRHTSIGVFEPNTGSWHLDNGNGKWDDCETDGDLCVTTDGAPGSLPVVKVLNARKLVVGTFHPQVTTRVGGKSVTRRGVWNFDLDGDGTLNRCGIDQCIENFGGSGDLPIVGDWNGTGGEEIGFFRPQAGHWYLDLSGNGKWDGSTVDRMMGPFGLPEDLPIVGDWDGTGKVRIGIYRPSTGEWIFDMNGNGNSDDCNVDTCLGPFGQTGDLPVVGKW